LDDLKAIKRKIVSIKDELRRDFGVEEIGQIVFG